MKKIIKKCVVKTWELSIFKYRRKMFLIMEFFGINKKNNLVVFKYPLKMRIVKMHTNIY